MKTRLSSESRTAKLWIQYMQNLNGVKQFIPAERTSDWHLHLRSVHVMLNAVDATRRNNYAKSGRLYLQLMENLPSNSSLVVCHVYLQETSHHSTFWQILDWIFNWSCHRTNNDESHKGKMWCDTWSWNRRKCAARVHKMHQCASVHMALNSLEESRLWISSKQV